jgi:hypothetical protein
MSNTSNSALSVILETIDTIAEYEISILSMNKDLEEADEFIKMLNSYIEEDNDEPIEKNEASEMLNDLMKAVEKSKKELETLNKNRDTLDNSLSKVVATGLPEVVQEMAIQTLNGKIIILNENTELKKEYIEARADDTKSVEKYTADIMKNEARAEIYKTYKEYLEGLEIVRNNSDEPGGLGGL